MAEIKPTRRVTRYEVSCLPEHMDDGDSFTVTVEYRGAGRWAVRNRGRTLGADGEWSWGYRWEGEPHEPVTDDEIESFNRGQNEWRAAHRFDEETALRLADEVAPRVTVNGYTVADILAETEATDAR